MAPCSRPGCAGVIEAGYCNVCGHSATATSSSRSTVTPTPLIEPTAEGGREPSGQARCERGDCAGVIEAGYCNVCGMAPVGASQKVAGSSAAGRPPPVSAGTHPSPTASAPSPETGTARLVAGDGASTGRTGTTARGSRGSRGNLGAGLVDIPPIPYRDPASAVLTDPQVPERKRHCAHCGEPVGRSRRDRPGRTEGFCGHCGRPFSFTPKLWPGDLVGGQYLVAGCIAHGGLGWIYLAQDKNVSDRWVVLKGLLDSTDESAMAAAIAERRFLAEVAHPSIVKIYNFVQHRDAGYIVMEYVGGESLREVRNNHREQNGAPLPLAQAIAYILEILPAVGFLHRRGLLFCDFKPDNVIQTEEELKLIDLGGVRAVDDQDSDLYGTIGYQAPEVPDVGASIASDLYTVARTLAILSFDFPGFQDEKRYATSLPPVAEVALFSRYQSFHHFLSKATALDPRARFQSADEMADQLVGVLREVIAIDGGHPTPVPSALFSGELGPGTPEGKWQELPIPAVDPFDPGAGLLATLAASGSHQVLATLEAAPRTPELALRLARSWIEQDAFVEAERELESPEARAAGWRVAWWRGVMYLAAGRPKDAESFFAAVAAELPGELAPKLALALAFERSALGIGEGSVQANGHPFDTGTADAFREAARYYEIVAATDPGFVSASFGLSRVRVALGDRTGAAEALESIPDSSSAHLAAQIAQCRVWCADVNGTRPVLRDLASASHVLERLGAEASVRLPLVRNLQEEALTLLVDGSLEPDEEVVLAGAALSEFDLRSALERTYRSLAKLASTNEARFALVDKANAHRPLTLT